MDLTTWKQPHAPAQPARLGPQSITDVHKSQGTGYSKLVSPLSGRAQRCPAHGWWHSSSVGVVALLRAARMALCPPSFPLTPPSFTPWLWEEDISFKISSSQALGTKAVQQSQELAALPVPVGTALCTWRQCSWTLCKVWGWGLLGQAAKTESSSTLAWSLLAWATCTG